MAHLPGGLQWLLTSLREVQKAQQEASSLLLSQVLPFCRGQRPAPGVLWSQEETGCREGGQADSSHFTHAHFGSGEEKRI